MIPSRPPDKTVLHIPLWRVDGRKSLDKERWRFFVRGNAWTARWWRGGQMWICSHRLCRNEQRHVTAGSADLDITEVVRVFLRYVEKGS